MAADATGELYGRCAALSTLDPHELTRQVTERVFVIAFLLDRQPVQVAAALTESVVETVPDGETWKLMCTDFTGYLQAVRG